MYSNIMIILLCFVSLSVVAQPVLGSRPGGHIHAHTPSTRVRQPSLTHSMSQSLQQSSAEEIGHNQHVYFIRVCHRYFLLHALPNWNFRFVSSIRFFFCRSHNIYKLVSPLLILFLNFFSYLRKYTLTVSFCIWLTRL